MTLSGRWLEEDGSGPTRPFAPKPKSDSNEPPMSAIKPVAPAPGRMGEQIPVFAAIGVIGYLVDATITYVCARYLGLSPELARPPGFIIATLVNFALNWSITFRHSRAPLFRAFLRYCGVASVGLAVNYAVYSACVASAPRIGIAVTPAILPLFVAAGSGAAMVLTFLGFRFFAFRA
jgi:putative flippase GtrA